MINIKNSNVLLEKNRKLDNVGSFAVIFRIPNGNHPLEIKKSTNQCFLVVSFPFISLCFCNDMNIFTKTIVPAMFKIMLPISSKRAKIGDIGNLKDKYKDINPININRNPGYFFCKYSTALYNLSSLYCREQETRSQLTRGSFHLKWVSPFH